MATVPTSSEAMVALWSSCELPTSPHCAKANPTSRSVVLLGRPMNHLFIPDGIYSSDYFCGATYTPLHLNKVCHMVFDEEEKVHVRLIT